MALILCRLQLHCDVERARDEGREELARLEALPSTPGMQAFIVAAREANANWAEEILPTQCTRLAAGESPPRGGARVELP